MNIVILKTKLFPNTEKLDDGLEHISLNHIIYVCDTTRDDMADSDWDKVVEKILDAKRIIVL